MFTFRENLIRPEYVQYHYQIYCRLLHRYFEHKYKNVKLARKKYCSVMSLLSEHDPLYKRCRHPLLEHVDTSLFSDLLIELNGLA